MYGMGFLRRCCCDIIDLSTLNDVDIHNDYICKITGYML